MIEDTATPPRSAPRAGSLGSRAFASVLVSLRWFVVLGWIAAAVLAVVFLPTLSTRSGGLSDITSRQNPAVLAETRAAELFGFPVLSRTLLVQRDPAGLSEATQQKAAETALATVERARGQGTGQGTGVLAALPVLNSRGLIPGSAESGTTIVTYLYPRPGETFGGAKRAAQAYAAQFDRAQDDVVGVTGSIPARLQQTSTVNRYLPVLEVVSVTAVLVLVGLAFRSIGAPLLTITTAGISYLLVSRVAAALAERYGWTIPPDLEPLMVALMVGVTTDYVVYFLAGLRGELVDGSPPLVAARRSVATFAPIVAAAGLTVVAGVATLVVAETPAVRVFGPAMAVAVAVALVVAVTFVPAAMAILGGRAFWPAVPAPGERARLAGWLRRAVARALTVRVVALLIAAACIAGLGVAAWPARDLHAGLPLVGSLPADTEEARAARAAAEGFAPGVVSPTLVALQGAGLEGQVEALGRFEELLAGEPHVAGVLGPREEEQVRQQTGRTVDVFTKGDAAQFVVVLDTDPLDATGVEAVDRLQQRLPDLVRAAGLTSVGWSAVAGDTAAVVAVVQEMQRDLVAVLALALLVNFLILAVVLRALVAPLILLACTVLSVAATLGITVTVFQDALGNPGVTFFVPLAAGVLLVALGSDYNLFAIGHVWEEARHRPLREAIVAALPRSSAAITTAGLALAASLGALALVPLRQFRELAFALGVGILLDTFLIRTLLVPALLTLVGPVSGWPGRRLRPRPAVEAPASEPAEVPSGASGGERVRPWLPARGDRT